MTLTSRAFFAHKVKMSVHYYYYYYGCYIINLRSAWLHNHFHRMHLLVHGPRAAGPGTTSKLCAFGLCVCVCVM